MSSVEQSGAHKHSLSFSLALSSVVLYSSSTIFNFECSFLCLRCVVEYRPISIHTNLTNRNVAFSLSCDSFVFIRLYCLFAPVQVAVILFHERETPTLFSHLFLNGNNLSVCSFFCCFAAGFLNGNISFSSFCLWFYTRKKIYWCNFVPFIFR